MDKQRDYVQERNSFRKFKSLEQLKIENIYSQISNLEQAIKKAQERIDTMRPKTERGLYVCPQSDCDCVSMVLISQRTEEWKYEGKPKAKGVTYYRCEICGYSEEKIGINSK